MIFDKYVVVLLKEGLNTTPIDATNLKKLQLSEVATLH